jgi:glycerol-3-phosphate dehydrogenase subunit C
MANMEPEKKARQVVEECADCDICRYLMDTDCLVFPELYRLWDKEKETGEKITSRELRYLVDLCSFCALCPCPPVRTNIIEAKTQFIDRDGLDFGVRTLEDVERVAKLCGTFPKLSNRLFSNRLTGALIKKSAGIHHERHIPNFPDQSFPQIAKKLNLNTRSQNRQKRKVAYFAGCTANYLFPDVPKAVVEVFQNSGIEVYYPQQKCCGMPSFLEGDRQLTLEFVRFNIDRLAETVKAGYDIICSCPTCGFMLKSILKEGAYYSGQYQASIGAGEDHIKIPLASAANNPGGRQFEIVKKKLYKNLFKDDGYFSAIDPFKRILVAENTWDLGEYLKSLQQTGELERPQSEYSGRMVYFPPCHLREQNFGQPYADLLKDIPGIELESITGKLYCCGMAGIMGFKREFHEASTQLGSRLMDKIRELNPEYIITDCLSCRLQFNQMLPHEVFHPIEILI